MQILPQYDNEIKEQGFEWRSCCTISQPHRHSFCSRRHAIQPRLLYNYSCHLASAPCTWFMDKMRAVTHSLRDQASLILSGAIKQPALDFWNWMILNCRYDFLHSFLVKPNWGHLKKSPSDFFFSCKESKNCTYPHICSSFTAEI